MTTTPNPTAEPCECGHNALDHHGIDRDPKNGGVLRHWTGVRVERPAEMRVHQDVQ